MQFRVLSYNIHKGIGGIDRRYKPERIINTIDYYKPNIVLLQEVDDGVRRSKMHRQVDMIADELSFKHRVFQANVMLNKGCYGNAILSHYPLSNPVDIELTVPPKKRRRGLCVEVNIANHEATQTIVLANVHLGLAAYERAIQVCRLADNDYISSRAVDKPIVLGGDFNDLWGNLCKKVLNAKGFTPTFGKTKTYPAVYPTRALDRFFHRGNIQVLRSFAGRTALARMASDHLPIIADFSF